MAREGAYSLEDKFDAAVRVIQSFPTEGPFQPSDGMMQMFHSYYKQAISGPCNTPRPTGFWDTQGKAEWDTWSSLGNMTKEEAMMNYVEDIQLILETVPVSDDVSDLVQKLGSFYTEVERDECEHHEVDNRPFTRPFASSADVFSKTFSKPLMEGYGDLWDDLQNLTEESKEDIDHDMTNCSQESPENMEEKEECRDWERAEEDEESGEHQEEVFLSGWSPVPRPSSGSAKPSTSSVTDGTHSSLNSDEEEELVCCVEPAHHESTDYTHPHRRLSEFLESPTEQIETTKQQCTTALAKKIQINDPCPEKYPRPTDSDHKEFCDSMEHLAMGEVWSPSNVQSRGSRAPTQKQGEPPLESLNLRHFNTAAKTGVNTHVTAALLHLQADMADVLHRLRALEIIATQPRSHSPNQEEPLQVARTSPGPSWWPFHFLPFSVAFTALWPVVAHWIIRLYLQWKKRKS